MKDYHINIFYSEEDAGYIADIPDLEACSAFEETPAEALEQVEIAKQAWLEAARNEGKPVPRPRYRLAIYQIASCLIIDVPALWVDGGGNQDGGGEGMKTASE